jgi:hypothetical protein
MSYSKKKNSDNSSGGSGGSGGCSDDDDLRVLRVVLSVLALGWILMIVSTCGIDDYTTRACTARTTGTVGSVEMIGGGPAGPAAAALSSSSSCRVAVSFVASAAASAAYAVSAADEDSAGRTYSGVVTVYEDAARCAMLARSEGIVVPVCYAALHPERDTKVDLDVEGNYVSFQVLRAYNVSGCVLIYAAFILQVLFMGYVCVRWCCSCYCCCRRCRCSGPVSGAGSGSGAECDSKEEKLLDAAYGAV